jgi:hypothetical protein
MHYLTWREGLKEWVMSAPKGFMHGWSFFVGAHLAGGAATWYLGAATAARLLACLLCACRIRLLRVWRIMRLISASVFAVCLALTHFSITNCRGGKSLYYRGPCLSPALATRLFLVHPRQWKRTLFIFSWFVLFILCWQLVWIVPFSCSSFWLFFFLALLHIPQPDMADRRWGGRGCECG